MKIKKIIVIRHPKGGGKLLQSVPKPLFFFCYPSLVPSSRDSPAITETTNATRVFHYWCLVVHLKSSILSSKFC